MPGVRCQHRHAHRHRASLPLLLTGGVLAGAGAGAAFRGSIAIVSSIAPPQARGEALAGLFLAAYAGLAVPVLGLGIATQLLSTKTAVLGFAVALILVVAAVSRKLLGASPGPAPVASPGPIPVASTDTKVTSSR